jgi:ADP-heptose:LPS heptosyltransferase
MLAKLLYKVRNRYHLHVGGWASRHWGGLSRALRYPVPALAPYQRRRLDVARMAGMGDVLMCTPALREVKRLNPSCHITFYAGFPEVVRGLPFIDEVRAFGERTPAAFLLACEGSLPPGRHLARIFGDNLGVVVEDVRPSCAIDAERVAEWQGRWRGLPRPVVVVHRYANAWTPNKDWPDAYWVKLMELLCPDASVVEIGRPDPALGQLEHPNYQDLRGKTMIVDLTALIAAADLFVGPISGPVHVAAAAGTPAVVVYGGFEHPLGSSYPGNIDLFTQMPCSPCWLKTPCPYDRECLRRITPETAWRAVRQLWEQSQVRPTGAARLPMVRRQA